MHGLCFISAHKIVSSLVDFPSVANHKKKVLTFRQYHKINIDRLKDDLTATAFVTSKFHNINTLYEQYMSSLSALFMQYFHDLVKENCGDGKKLWRVLSKVLDRSQFDSDLV